MKSAIIDFGSRSAKLYANRNHDIEIVHTLSYDLINQEPSAYEITEIIDCLLAQHEYSYQSITVVATEAARRSPSLAAKLASACKDRGIIYETISQKKEAELISRAFRNDSHKGCEIINAGGGSIQIVRPNGEIHLVPFGISDLNTKFLLTGPPADRAFEACRDFICQYLPDELSAFIYTGGEETYLRSCGIELSYDGSCSREDFMSLTKYILTKSTHELDILSPYGKNWMTGAIASSAIVEAALTCSGQDCFFPSDVNIAHGLVGAIMETTE